MGTGSIRQGTLCHCKHDPSGRHTVWAAAVTGKKRQRLFLFPLCRRGRETRLPEEEKNNFTEYFHSAVVFGKAEIVEDDTEKVLALRLLCERFLPKYMEHFDEAIARSLSMTTVVRITLTEPPVGKCKH